MKKSFALLVLALTLTLGVTACDPDGGLPKPQLNSK
jgi:predicted small lipoprotein YifL